VANQQQSPFRDWFKVRSWDDPVAGTKFAYDGWFGVENLPELKQDERGIVSGPRDYIFAATRRWMDPNADGDPDDGIDGWRLDVAFCVRHAFWKDWREHVRSINPDAYLVAEVIEAVPDQTPYLTGDEFDAVMNYNFGFACAEFFISQKDRIWASEFDRRLQQLREAYPAEVALGMMNLFASHDSNRLASQIVNRDGPVAYRQWSKYHRWSQAQHNPSYDTRKPTADEVQIQKLLAIFQMTYVGAPLIYYGDEAGMWGANDPCCRKPMVWPELDYEEEATLPNGKMKFRPDPVHFDEELFRHYQRLIHIRNRSPALQLGDFRTLLCDDTNDIYAFARQHGGEQVIVVLNNHHAMQQVTLLQPGTFVDHLNQDARYQSLDGKLCLAVAAKWGCILRRQDRLETMGSSTT
jgi:glycosidase